MNNVHNPNNEFLDSLASNSFLPYILQPTRITSRSSTLIDNIFTNIILPDSISGNLTATISDHLLLFLIVLNIFSNPLSNKSNIYGRDWSNFDHSWLFFYKLEWNTENRGTKYWLLHWNIFKINKLLDNFASFKKISMYKLKFKLKPWITPGLLK